MNSLTSISFIGAGNLAWHLAPAFDNTDFAVREVYSHRRSHAEKLVSRLYEAEVKETLDFVNSPSRIFILAVPDDTIETVVEALELPENAVLVHTSGSQPLAALDGAETPCTGVFYPLQTFSKDKSINLQETPIFVESEHKETEKLLLKMAKSISQEVHKITSQKRRALHVAAVFSCNFANDMLAIAHEIMNDARLDFKWLKPLIAETFNKSLTLGPEKAQTGPARRGDLETLDKHMEYLEEDETLAEIYRLISQHILDRYVS